MTENSNARKKALRGGRLRSDGTREHVYSPELAAEICRRVSLGETLSAVCNSLGFDVATVRDWCVSDRGGFAQNYARARRAQVEGWSDQLLEIADDNSLEPNDRRVRLDVRKWLMSKLNPAHYGERVQLAGDPDNPIHHTVAVIDLSRLSSPELDALERFTDARLTARDVQDHSD